MRERFFAATMKVYNKLIQVQNIVSNASTVLESLNIISTRYLLLAMIKPVQAIKLDLVL